MNFYARYIKYYSRSIAYRLLTYFGLLVICFLAFPNFSKAYTTFTIDPHEQDVTDCHNVLIVDYVDVPSWSSVYDWDTGNFVFGSVTAMPTTLHKDFCEVYDISSIPIGHYRVVQVNANIDSMGLCNFPNGYSFCLGTGAIAAEQELIISPPGGIPGLILTASSTFANDLGFGLGDVEGTMKNLALLVMGSGVGVLRAMLPFVLVLAFMFGCIYFFYRAFRFFRH